MVVIDVPSSEPVPRIGGYRWQRLHPPAQVVASINVRRPRFTARKAPDWMASYSAVRPAHAIEHASGTLYASAGFVMISLVRLPGRDDPGHARVTATVVGLERRGSAQKADVTFYFAL